MAGNRSPMPALISKINSSPSFFIRTDVNYVEPVRFPAVSPVFMSAEKKSSKFSRYQTTHDHSFSPSNRTNFPAEMSPIRMEIQRAKHSGFSESFIGGMYRDNRMGVSELRQKRILKLNKKRQLVAQAQSKVLVELKRLEAVKLNQELVNEEKKHQIIQRNAAYMIQRMVRSKLSWRALWKNIHRLIEIEKLDKVKAVFAVRIQLWALDCLERHAKLRTAAFEQEKLEAQQEDDMLNMDNWDMDDEFMPSRSQSREPSRPHSRESSRSRPRSRESSRPHSREHRESSRPHSREHSRPHSREHQSSRPHSKESSRGEPLGSLGSVVGAVLPKWGEKVFGHVDHVDETVCANKWLDNHHHHHHSHHNVLGHDAPIHDSYHDDGSSARSRDSSRYSRSSGSSFSDAYLHETVEETLNRYNDRDKETLNRCAMVIQRNSRRMVYSNRYTRKKRALVTFAWFFACFFETCPVSLKQKYDISRPPFSKKGGVQDIEDACSKDDDVSDGLEASHSANEIAVKEREEEFKKFDYDAKHKKSARVIQSIFREIRAIRVIKQEMIRSKLEASERASRLAKQMLSNFPADGPDTTASNHWLKTKHHSDHHKEDVRVAIPGPIDLSRSTRGAFWLNTHDSESPIRGGMRRSPARATSIRGSSVSQMLSAGIKR